MRRGDGASCMVASDRTCRGDGDDIAPTWVSGARFAPIRSSLFVVIMCDPECDCDEVADRRRSPINARGQSQGRLRRVAVQPQIDDIVCSEMLQGFWHNRNAE